MKTQRIWQESSKKYLHNQELQQGANLATGVRDSDDQEIYEGDILLQHMNSELEKSGRKPNLGYVYYDRGSFFIRGGGPLWNYLNEESSSIPEYRVVGNLQENPELENWA